MLLCSVILLHQQHRRAFLGHTISNQQSVCRLKRDPIKAINRFVFKRHANTITRLELTDLDFAVVHHFIQGQSETSQRAFAQQDSNRSMYIRLNPVDRDA